MAQQQLPLRSLADDYGLKSGHLRRPPPPPPSPPSLRAVSLDGAEEPKQEAGQAGSSNGEATSEPEEVKARGVEAINVVGGEKLERDQAADNRGVVGGEEGEDEGECGFCLFMKGGGCMESFVAWERCMEEAEEGEENLVEKCAGVTGSLVRCMEAHPDYYEPVLRAEKATGEEVPPSPELQDRR